MVHLSAPLVVAVVLSPLGHVPEVLAASEVLMLVTDPSLMEPRRREESKTDTQQQENVYHNLNGWKTKLQSVNLQVQGGLKVLHGTSLLSKLQ